MRVIVLPESTQSCQMRQPASAKLNRYIQSYAAEISA